MMKISVKRDLCCGAQLCVQIAPDVFCLDAQGYNDSDGREVAPSKQAAAEKAARACPESAIQLLSVDVASKV